jgi:3-hydroxyacyl-CoA dehydrogenase-like protein
VNRGSAVADLRVGVLGAGLMGAGIAAVFAATRPRRRVDPGR